jgi:hypothetical protein
MMGFQAGHIDEGFYDEYYRPESLSDTHRRHMKEWHGEDDGGRWASNTAR